MTAVSIIRISGPSAHDVLRAMTKRALPEPRMLCRRDLFDQSGSPLDRAMAVLFKEGQSFTGDAMVEIHCHGGRAVVRSILNEIGNFGKVRLADPGEFTQRAFLSGRLDLAEVEGLADLISAETEMQRKVAMSLFSGDLSSQIEVWRADLLRACALVEVTIDWADEEVPEDVAPEVFATLARLRRELNEQLQNSERTGKLRSGYSVAIIGAPNAGKSSLLNALAGREAAIVSDVPGTTRDVLEVRYDLNGLPITFLDTAGLRATSDHIEAIGVGRAKARASAADLRLILQTADAPLDEFTASLAQENDLFVWTKNDIFDGAGDVSVSASRGLGIDQLLEVIAERIGGGMSNGFGLISAERHKKCVSEAIFHLSEILREDVTWEAEELADELRAVSFFLDQVVGRVGVEDVLGEVFGSFCLGK